MNSESANIDDVIRNLEEDPFVSLKWPDVVELLLKALRFYRDCTTGNWWEFGSQGLNVHQCRAKDDKDFVKWLVALRLRYAFPVTQSPSNLDKADAVTEVLGYLGKTTIDIPAPTPTLFPWLASMVVT